MANRDLQIGLWTLTLRSKQRMFTLLLLGVCDALALALAFFFGVRLLRTASPVTLAAALAVSQGPDATVLERLAPPTVTLTEIAVIAQSGTAYDLAAVARNPSSRWTLEGAAYAFRFGSATLAEGRFALGPGEERFLFVPALRRSAAALPTDVRLSVSNPQWQRVDERTPPATPLLVRAPAYRVLSTAPSAPLSSVTAEIVNPSPVESVTAEVTAILRNGGIVVGAAQLRIEQLQPNSARAVDIRLFRVLTVTDVQVRAIVVREEDA